MKSIKLPAYSPFYAAYAAQAKAMDAAVKAAAEKSAKQMGASFSLVYNTTEQAVQKLAA